MDDSAEVIKSFEELFKKNAKKTSLPLYNSEDKNRQSLKKQLRNPQDIISNISLQLKAIQKADTVNTKNVRNSLFRYKKSSFLPVNMLQKDNVIPQPSNANKFETQFELDTQLMDIMENAEELIGTKNGIVQEFESTFYVDDLEEKTNHNTVNTNLSYSSTKDDESNCNNNKVVVKNTISTSGDVKKEAKLDETNDLQDHTQFNNNFELKICNDKETKISLDKSAEEDLPCSYVFEPIKKSNTPSPLVFDLYSFEDFERIAIPIIEEHPDIKSAKHLINSQIVGRELLIRTDDVPQFCTGDTPLSPVLQITADKLKVTKTPNTDNSYNAISNKDHISVTDLMKDSLFLKDDIIFSSDEESEYVHKRSQDLPLTCALETSFYNQSQVLDKTMYVCFQTASNRSIQVCTESYTMAKSFLDGTNEDNENKVTFTELVEMCDIPKKTSEITVTNDSQGIQNSMNLMSTSINIDLSVDDIFSDDANDDKAHSNNITESVDIQKNYTNNVKTNKITTNSQSSHLRTAPVKRTFDGFVTASNKKIKLSEQALAKSKEVFKDIDLEDNIGAEKDLKKESEDAGSTEDEVMSVVDTHHIDEDILNEFDQDMPLIENKQEETTVCIGFKTASNKNTHISDAAALAKTKTIFDDLDSSDFNKTVTSSKLSQNENDGRLNKHNKDLHPPHFVGFKTASNKDIEIPKEALAKSKNILKDIIDNKINYDKIESQDKCLNWDQPSTSKQHVCGFKTASNKEIKISAEAVAKSTPLLKDFIENDLDFNSEQDRDLNKFDLYHPRSDNYVGFRTANNKEITISEAAYSKTKNIFKNIVICDEELENVEEVSKKEVTGVIKDFQLEPELQEVNKLQHEICDDFSKAFENVSSVPQDIVKPKLCGFKTASDKAVNVSEKAIIESKKLFADLDLDSEFNCFDKENSAKLNHKAKLENHVERVQDFIITKSKTCTNIETVNQCLFDGNNKAFVCFKTASNKKDKISEKSLAKSKKLFNNLEVVNLETSNEKITMAEEIVQRNYKEESRYNQENDIPKFQSFQTASKKPIHISEKAIERSKALFKDIEDIKCASKNAQPETNQLQLKGFETANKKPIKISAQAMAKSLPILKDIDSENCNDRSPNNTDSKDLPDKVIMFKGFKTASENPVHVSVEAMAKSVALFKDINNDDISILNMKQNKKCQTTCDKKLANEMPIFKGFQTASKKPVKISEEALSKSKALFNDIDNNSIINKKKCQQEQDGSPTNKESIFRGFETASRKPVKISAEALTKSRALFKDIDDHNIGNPKLCQVEQYGSPPIKEPTFIEFETASRKPLKISAYALAKSKALLNDIVCDNVDNQKVEQDGSPNKEPIFRGFETASRKPVQISAEALAKSKLLFKDIDNSQTAEASPKFQGFQTGNNKAVIVSDEALMKSKKVLEARKDIGFSGFQTANKKKVFISDDALKHSQLLFQDINDKSSKSVDKIKALNTEHENKESLDINVKKTPFCFKSANNNSLEVSQDALIKSRRIFTSDLKNDKPELATKAENSLERLIDTQVINNFEETLHTEDFCADTTPRQSKRSGSPILSCPKAKRRKKFETPYRTEIIPKRNIIPNTESKIEHISKTVLFSEDLKTKRYTLKDLANVEKNSQNPNPNIYSDISNFNLDTLVDFKFNGKRNDVTDIDISVEDVKYLFQNAVNKKLIPDGWLDNHIKLIIWKLLSYEVKFPNTLCGVCTVKNVLDQLKHRFDRELYNAERPALRKILEKDDVASKTIVLCVAAVYVDGVSVSSVTSETSNVELLLTDGWYCVKATIDKMLIRLVYDEKITVGCKIVTNGAELVNCEQGVAPWEDTSSVRLKIFGNSTRRARWDARLGYHGNAAILAPLSTVKVEGGKVSKLRLLVARVYPALFVEKFEDGSTVTRSERLETIYQLKYESERQIIMEKLYEEVERELSDQESQDSESSYNNKRKLFNGSQLESSSQTRTLEERSNKRREKLIQNIQTKLQDKIESHGLNVKRNVIHLLKVRVAGVNKDSIEITKGLMSIWKPNDAITEIIREGMWIEVLNVVPTAIRYSEMQISAGRNSVFRESRVKASDKMLPYLKNLQRKCYHIKELAINPTISTDYNEIDTAGFVFQIDPKTIDFESSKQPFQNVYLTDAERNIICVNFWGGLKKFGYHNVLDTGQVVACVNLQKRSGNTKKTIPQYRVTEFSYFTKTPKNIEARNIVEELVKKLSGLDKRKYCEDCIVLKNNFNKSLNYSNENISPYRMNNIHNLTKNRIFIDSPLAQKPIDDNLNLTGLDFESTFKQNTQEVSPQILLRKKKVNDRIAKLKMYGEPPPLSPIHIINKSKNALNSYKSPLAANDNVASLKNLALNSRKVDSDLQSSPVLSMNRTYVKTVNPVKLNFSYLQNDTVDDDIDHFAEDFDASPPLSLD